ncbi:MAG: multicopper oxidase domain-containing protein, partial [Myxococcales bacterium]|nr:multicopper oxidase domain-containing protein [Myxococcales bacterium]
GTGGELAGPPGSGTSYNRVPFHMIANDGNLMEHAVYFDGNKTVGGLTAHKGILPTQGVGERYDIIVDFGPFAPGTKLYMVNLLEHRNGKAPHEKIPLGEVLNGTYAPQVENGRNKTDTTVAKFLEFRVHAYAGVDRSMNPTEYTPEGGKKMVPLPGFTQEDLDNAVHRSFDFGRSSGTDSQPWTIKTDGGAGFNADPRRVSAAPNLGYDKKGVAEIWHLKSPGGWAHPIHIHFEEGQILKRGGKAPPEWEKWARKDFYRLGPMEDSGFTIDLAVRFREFVGTYMEHCHNTAHEDHAMLLRFDTESPDQVRVMPAPMPTWDGVGYVSSYALPTFRSGDLKAKADYVGGVNGAGSSIPVPSPDGDDDGVSDDIDNCREFPNSDQRDSNGDGYGNWCDPDFDDNGIVNFSDFMQFRMGWGGDNPDIDLNGDGTINFGDFGILISRFFGPPGPGATQ